jgi:hypothetical protein
VADKKLIIIALVGGGALLLLPRLSRAQSLVPTDINSIVPTQPTVPGSSVPQVQVEQLESITGADWRLPLILTVERDISFGILDWIISGASALWEAGGVVISTAGDYLGTALSGTSSFVAGTLIPGVVDVSGTVGGIIMDVGSTAWDATKAIGGAIGGVAGQAWDVVSGGVTGSVEWIASHSEEIVDATKAAAALAGTVYTIKKMDQTSVTTNPNEAQSPSSVQTTSPAQVVEPTTATIGYLSSTSFTFKGLPALRVTRMYHPQYKDTMIVTNDEAIKVAQGVGYQVTGNLGYAAPAPFQYCVPMITLYNPTTIDHIVITNPDGVAKLESIGYKNEGYIGYCRALQV